MNLNELHAMPRAEDVTTIEADNHTLHVVEVTDENRSHLVNLAVSMYTNEPCRICGVLLTMEDMRNGAVFAGYSNDNAARSAHGDCWRKYPSDAAGTPRPEWVHQ